MNDMQPPEAILVATPEPIAPPQKRVGRPKGAKNKPKTVKAAKPQAGPAPSKVISNLQAALNKEVSNHDMTMLEVQVLKKNIEVLKREKASLSSVIDYLESKLREAWKDC